MARKKPDFEPKIVGFCCNWCTSNAADLAGTTRMQYPPNIHIIRVMCSGSVDPVYIVKALMEGADGVLVGGCRPGDCHYVSGNFKERRRVILLNGILDSLGLDPDRVWLRWIGADEGRKFANTVEEMTTHLKKLGRNPLSEEWEV